MRGFYGRLKYGIEALYKRLFIQTTRFAVTLILVSYRIETAAPCPSPSCSSPLNHSLEPWCRLEALLLPFFVARSVRRHNASGGCIEKTPSLVDGREIRQRSFSPELIQLLSQEFDPTASASAGSLSFIPPRRRYLYTLFVWEDTLSRIRNALRKLHQRPDQEAASLHRYLPPTNLPSNC